MVEPLILIPVIIIALLTPVVVFSRNPITCAFSLVGVMLTLAVIYALVGAHFAAALQAIVYAGAVMVLFVFSIMLLNMNKEEREIDFRSWKTYASFGTVGLLFCLFGVAMVRWSAETRLPAQGVWTLEHIRSVGGNSLAVSSSLFAEHFVQFELISLLLLVAIAGALVLAKRKVD